MEGMLSVLVGGVVLWAGGEAWYAGYVAHQHTPTQTELEASNAIR